MSCTQQKITLVLVKKNNIGLQKGIDGGSWVRSELMRQHSSVVVDVKLMLTNFISYKSFHIYWSS